MGCGVICFVCCLSLLFGAGVFGYPDEDLVTGLPGQPEVSFRQFSGYVDVDEKAGRSLFYYFVEAEKDVHRLPLTLWLNGVGLLCPPPLPAICPFVPTTPARTLLICAHRP
nr:serine carboxypeptidase-like 42 [Ipomoea batatas]